jgi:DHA1 family tetracycline resistance protein-like MFS transporter
MPKLPKLNDYNYPQLTPLWVAVFVDILGFSVLIPYLPFFSQRYGVPAWQIGLLLSTNAVFSLFSGPIWGSLSDKYGRKPMLLVSQLGTLIAFLMLAFSNSMLMMFASRIIDGIFGGNYPIAKAVVGDVVPAKFRSEQMSNIGVAHVLSSLIGPAISGFLAPYGIIGPGLGSAALTLMTITVTLLFLRESNPLITGVYADDDQQEMSRDIDNKRPVVSRKQVLQNPQARYFLIQWGFHTLSFMIYISSISLFANLKLGLNAQQVARLLMISGAVRVFIRFVVFIPLRRRLGDRVTSMLGLGIFVIVYFLLGFVTTPVQFGVILCCVSFAAACSRGILTSFLSRSVKPWEQGTAMGLSSSFDSFAQITGPLLSGVVLDTAPLWVYGGIASLFACGAFVMVFRRFQFVDEKPHHQYTIAETSTAGSDV